MPVIVRELILRIKSEPTERPAVRPEPYRTAAGGEEDEELLREAVAETLRVLREKKER